MRHQRFDCPGCQDVVVVEKEDVVGRRLRQPEGTDLTLRGVILLAELLRGVHTRFRMAVQQAHEIVASELTQDDVGDVSELPELLDQIEADIASLTADGAYDGEAVYDAIAERHPEASVIIPPRTTAIPSETTTTQRDRHLEAIGKHGRIGWQRSSGYSRRSLVETAVYRYKTIIGRRLHARTLPNQRTEAKIGCNVLNRMTGLGMPVSVRIV